MSSGSATDPVLSVVSRETRDRLGIFGELVRKWSPRINLVSRGSLEELETRHIADSVQLFDLAEVRKGRWLDMGSGGGFPGAVVAIVAAESAPGLNVTLVESDQRKAVFLRTVSRETGVGFQVIADRIEALPPFRANVVSARALAPLTRLLAHAARHLAPDGVALFPKGASHEAELQAAQELWTFEHNRFPSRTDDSSVIFRIGKVQRV